MKPYIYRNLPKNPIVPRAYDPYRSAISRAGTDRARAASPDGDSAESDTADGARPDHRAAQKRRPDGLRLRPKIKEPQTDGLQLLKTYESALHPRIESQATGPYRERR